MPALAKRDRNDPLLGVSAGESGICGLLFYVAGRSREWGGYFADFRAVRYRGDLSVHCGLWRDTEIFEMSGVGAGGAGACEIVIGLNGDANGGQRTLREFASLADAGTGCAEMAQLW